MYQRVTIIGSLGSDPEMRYMPNGDAVTTFSVATNRKWKGKDGVHCEETVWFRVSARRRLGEVCNQYLHKGSQIFIESRLTADKETGSHCIWNAKDGTPHASSELMGLEIKFLGSSQNGDNSAAPQNSGSTSPAALTDADIQF